MHQKNLFTQIAFKRLRLSTFNQSSVQVDGFVRNGYIVYRSDYRGQGFSEGEMKRYPDADPARIVMRGHAMGGAVQIFSQGIPGKGRRHLSYRVSAALSRNARSRVAQNLEPHPFMGGLLTLRSMVTTKEIKAGVIWAGVVASYPELYNRGNQ